MTNVFLKFEAHTDLKPRPVALILDCPLPTYYQYRRTGKAPAVVLRFLEILQAMPDEYFDKVVNHYMVTDDDDEL